MYSSKPAAADVIGIDLGTTNSCVSVMEGKVWSFFSFPVPFEICYLFLFVKQLVRPLVADSVAYLELQYSC